MIYRRLVEEGLIPPRGYSLEVVGTAGSARRLVAWEAVDALLGEGPVLYVDLSGRYTHMLRLKGRVPEGLYLYTTPSPGDIVSLMEGGGYSLVVLDSLPRLFFDMEAPYRGRWGATALVLYTGLALAARDGRFIALNYLSRRPFGDSLFTHYFTHRVRVSAGGDGLRVEKLYPGSGEIVLGDVKGGWEEGDAPRPV